MHNGRRISRFQASWLPIQKLPINSRHGIHESRYRHILVSTSLNVADRATLLLGFELASLHQSALTLLHVLPREEPDRVAYGLDAIGLLHVAAEKLRGAPTASPSGEAARSKLRKFVEEIVPQELRNTVSWRGECRPGEVAETVVSYVNESGADLVLVSAKPLRSWLPLVSCAVRTIERLARANVIVVRG